MASAAAAQEREDWYLAAHDHRETGLGVLVVTLDDGSQWIRVIDLKLLDLPVPAVPTRTHAGEAIVPLASLGMAYEIDPVGGRLHLRAGDRAVAADGDAGAATDLILDIVVNGQSLVEPQITRRDGDSILLSRDTLARANIPPPAEMTGRDWIPVQALAGQRYVLDEGRMRLALSVSPEAFNPTRLEADGMPHPGPEPPLAPSPLAMIVGYDIAASRSAEGARSAGLLLDTGISGSRASCRDRRLWRSGLPAARLESTCHIDWPERRLSLVVGDGISQDSTLSAPVRYGGVRIGSDFALQPDLRTQPMLGIEGTARLPSLLEVWIEQQLALRTEIPPGQFIVDGIPARTGRGSVSAVITDALGRQVLVDAPFYSDPRLLRSGLADWSLEFGRLRQGFLGRDDHYGERFGLLSLRRGVGNYWTVEARAEWQPSHHLVGIGNWLRLGRFGIAELSAARSSGSGRAGDAHAAGYTYQGKRWNFGMRYAAYEAGYRDLAYPSGGAPEREARASAGVRIGRLSLSAAGIMRNERDSGEQRLLRAGLSLPIGKGHLGVSAVRLLDTDGDTFLTAAFTLPLSGRRSASAWINDSGGRPAPGLMLQKGLPAGPGTGYRLLYEDTASGPRAAAEVLLRGGAGQIGAMVTSSRDGTGMDVRAGGALVVADRDVFLAPDGDGSFALVRLPQAGARIMREHQYAATTRSDGKTLVAGLRPFDRNRLSVAAESLETSTRIDAPAVEVVPGRRHVVLADFGAGQVLPLTLRVLQADGIPVPTGAEALADGGEPVQAGYDGLLYLELTRMPGDIEVRWGDTRCAIPADAFPPEPDPALVYEVTCQ